MGVRIEVEGVSGAVRENVLSGLSLRTAAREGRLAPEQVRRPHGRAGVEIRLALQAFGFYQPHIESQLITEADRWTARYRIEPGTDRRAIQRIRDGQTDERVRAIYAALKDEPKVRWKESFKQVLGLDLAERPGLDI